MEDYYISTKHFYFTFRQEKSFKPLLQAFQTAGVIDATSAAVIHPNNNCSKIHGGIVAINTCIYPTPGSINNFIQAGGSYEDVPNNTPAKFYFLLRRNIKKLETIIEKHILQDIYKWVASNNNKIY